MAFTIDDAFLPATLTAPPMSDEEFAAFCAEHPDLFFETSAEGDLIVMPPTYFATGASNADIAGQLWQWASKDQTGIATDSSTGFVLPNGARRSLDAAWTLKTRLIAQKRADLNRFLHLCPDFVIELRSTSDRLSALRVKMREYLTNGAELGWLIDPQADAVTIYRPGNLEETLTGIDSIAGEGPVAGFVLDLKSVWNPL